MHVDPLPPAEDDGPFDDVSQLADVSGPAVIPQDVDRLVGETRNGPVAAPAEEDHEALGQRDQVLRPLPQRGKRDLDHVEPVVEILPEPPLPKGLFQVDVRRRDDPHVGPARHIVAKALVLLVLDEPEELRLEGEGKIADLVQQKGPALAGADTAGIVADGAGEGPLGVAEQLAFQKLRR